MPFSGKSLLEVGSLSSETVYQVFEVSRKFRFQFSNHGYFAKQPLWDRPKVLALLFFEPSTRTRFSFEVAAHRIGLGVVHMESPAGSSLEKGETYIDTVLTAAAMSPDALVLRAPNQPELEALLKELQLPVISGGTGATAHPTQALLDAFTIFEERGRIEGEKVLLIGDIKHSRVAKSDIRLFEKLGAEVAMVGPDYFKPEEQEFADISCFDNLMEGLEWASVCMALRIQNERMTEAASMQLDPSHFVARYGLSAEKLKVFDPRGIIMHPGPANRGVELADDVYLDSRCRISHQVENGVFIRAALLAAILGDQ